MFDQGRQDILDRFLAFMGAALPRYRINHVWFVNRL